MTETAGHETTHPAAAPREEGVVTLTRVGLVVLMLVIAMVGLAIAQAYANAGWVVWMVVVVIYALIGMWLSWKHAPAAHKPRFAQLRAHIYHWFGLLVMIKVLFILEQLEYVKGTTVSDMALMMLALTCYLAGIHLEPIMVVVGIFLAVMAFVAAYFNQYILIIMVPAGVVAVFVVSLLPRLFAKRRVE